MSNAIREVAEIWRKRIREEIQKKGFNQRQFAEEYTKRFGIEVLPDGSKKITKTSQADVSRWMNVGNLYGKTNKLIGFPDFKTIRNIAEFLDVSVGYLIGETNEETFEMEKATLYTGLSSASIKSIRDITVTGRATSPFWEDNNDNNSFYPDHNITEALNYLLCNPLFVKYLEAICEYAYFLEAEKKPKNIFETALNNLPKERREDALALFEDKEEASKVKPTVDLLYYKSVLEDACITDNEQSIEAERNTKAARFAIQEIQTEILNGIMSEENIKLLSRSPSP